MTEPVTLDIAEMLPATFTAPSMTEAEFVDLCQKFPDASLEYTPDGTLIIMPPTDPESARRNFRVVQQLGNWADEQGKGIVFGPDGGFFLPDGARRSPDACWFDAARWEAAKTPGTRFPVFAPEFVIEVRSPGDRLPVLQAKMEEYIANGVQLGWLIDPSARAVTIYRPGQAPHTLNHPVSVNGEGPVDGFVLTLERIFT